MFSRRMRKASLCMVLMFLAMGTRQVQAGPGTLATEAGVSPSGGTFYANSPYGTWSYTDAFGATRASNSGIPLRKFVDKLPGLGLPNCTRSNPFGTGTCNENNLGQYIPLAEAVTPPNGTPGTGVDAAGATVPSDYYELATVEYSEKLHSDLPKSTKLRGYVDVGNGKTPTPHYLGATILAYRDKPVRIKMENRLSGGLFLPLDNTYMGAGYGPPVLKSNHATLCTPVDVAGNLCDRLPYSQNRIAIHLHGGHTPWISDGTPHQWFTPAAENLSSLAGAYKKGASFMNVPDMTDPGPGFQTLYYTNQQSARLMFYHDHAFGITRLNVYAGMAAGYLLVDKAIEDPLISSGTLPGSGLPAVYNYGIPLVIQDKTFVPQDIAVQDAKWSKTPGGTYGDLWFPHVLESNQDPYSTEHSGANDFGRWDYGPWFWPPLVFCNQPDAPAICIDLDNPKSPYPGLPAPEWDITATPESFMDTPLVNGTAYPYLEVAPQAYRFRILSAGNDRPLNLQMYVSDPTSPGNFIQTATGKPTEVAMVAAVPRPDCTATSPAATPAVPSTCTCTAVSAPLGCFPTTWPIDGRDGGVPDPQFAGPKFIQIANESGWLPKPVVIDNQPVSFEYNRRTIVVLDVLNKSLLLAPAERADVIVDFSAFAGKTIILYNDAPAPMPAFDVRYDYFTGDASQLAFGGAATTQPGYGPNTRTIMQFRVVAGTPQNNPPYYDPLSSKLGSLNTAVTNAFNDVTLPAPIVPETANGGTSDVYSSIFDNSLTFTPVGSTTGATTVWFQPKAIQELWDNFGRMNATLGVELPKTNNTTQTTIPLGYNDPVTENLSEGGIQIWKITHNGVDTHPVHFHLTDVQLINRVGWDGAIRPPDPNEVGWKETIKMKPLEDVIVALRPSMPKLPFVLPESNRLHDPSEPLGAILNVTNTADGNPLLITNAVENFGNEFVWHCHILGHEENDFMRPVVFTVQTAAPPALTLTVSPTSLSRPYQVDMSWTDASTAASAVNYYQIQRAPNAGGVPGTFATIATVASGLTYTDTSVAANTTYWYQVVAVNSVGSTTSNFVSVTTSNWALTSITLNTNGTAFSAPAAINLSATVTSTGTINRVEYFVGAQRLTRVFTGVLGSPSYTFAWTGVFPGTYVLTAQVFDTLGTMTASSPVTVTVGAPVQIVRTPLVPYVNVQDAYNAALTGDTIKVMAGTDTGTLLANRPGINVTITGGFDSSFVTNIGTTTLQGKVSINQGKVVLNQIKVVPAALVSIAVTPANPTVSVAATQQMTATGTYADASTADLTALVTWNSATPAAATINAAGLVSSVATGSSLVTATLGTVSGNTTVTVP